MYPGYGWGTIGVVYCPGVHRGDGRPLVWWEVLVNFMQEKCEMLKRHWLLQLVELEEFLFATPPVPLVHSMETEDWVPEFSANISPALFRCYALDLAAVSPGGQRGQTVHPGQQGQACRVPLPAGAA